MDFYCNKFCIFMIKNRMYNKISKIKNLIIYDLIIYLYDI